MPPPTTHFGEIHVFTAQGKSPNIYLKAGKNEKLIIDGSVDIGTETGGGGGGGGGGGTGTTDITIGGCGTTSDILIKGENIEIGGDCTTQITMNSSAFVDIFGADISINQGTGGSLEMGTSDGLVLVYGDQTYIGDIELVTNDFTVTSDPESDPDKTLLSVVPEQIKLRSNTEITTDTLSLQQESLQFSSTVLVTADNYALTEGYYGVATQQVDFTREPYNNGRTYYVGIGNPAIYMSSSGNTYVEGTTYTDKVHKYVACDGADTFIVASYVGSGGGTYAIINSSVTGTTSFDGSDTIVAVNSTSGSYPTEIQYSEGGGMFMISDTLGKICVSWNKGRGWTPYSTALTDQITGFCFNPRSKTMYVGYTTNGGDLYYSTINFPFTTPVSWGQALAGIANRTWGRGHYSTIFGRVFFSNHGTSTKPRLYYSNTAEFSGGFNASNYIEFNDTGDPIGCFLDLHEYRLLVVGVGNTIYFVDENLTVKYARSIGGDYVSQQISYEAKKRRFHLAGKKNYGYFDILDPTADRIDNIVIGDVPTTAVTLRGFKTDIESTYTYINSPYIRIGNSGDIYGEKSILNLDGTHITADRLTMDVQTQFRLHSDSILIGYIPDSKIYIGSEGTHTIALNSNTCGIGLTANSNVNIGMSTSNSVTIQGATINAGTNTANNFVTIGKSDSNTVTVQGNTVSLCPSSGYTKLYGYPFGVYARFGLNGQTGLTDIFNPIPYSVKDFSQDPDGIISWNGTYGVQVTTEGLYLVNIAYELSAGTVQQIVFRIYASNGTERTGSTDQRIGPDVPTAISNFTYSSVIRCQAGDFISPYLYCATTTVRINDTFRTFLLVYKLAGKL